MSSPRLIPNVNLDEIQHGSERTVAKALMATLDDGWTIFHNYCWLRSQLGYKTNHLVEGEADFVLLHRKWGLLVLEVKGGDIAYDVDDCQWLQNGGKMKDPFKQAQKNMHALTDQIVERSNFLTKPVGKGLPCPYGYAAVFPSCNFTGTLPPGVHASILFGASHLQGLGAFVLAAAKHWSTAHQPPPMEPADFKAVKAAITSTFRLVPSLARKIEQDEEVLIQLTHDQAEKLQGLFDNPRVAVEGVAGSGKTLLALLRAETYASEGKEVLFLCFNRKLGESLARRAAHIDNLKVVHFHRLCRDMCVQAGLDFEVPKDRDEANEFWGNLAPELLMDAIDELPQFRYDAVVVDEAQDFKDRWWIAIDKLTRQPKGPLYLFYDRAQNLFANNLKFPSMGTHYNLGTNCRNTKSIAAGCSKVLGQEIRTPAFSPVGDKPTLHKTGKATEICQKCASILTQSITKEGLSPSKVAIISTRGLKSSCLSDGKVGDYLLTDDVEDWESGKAVWFSTIKAFKGLEADVLIVIEAGDFDPTYFSRHDLYVAASRARHRLVVITSSNEVEAFFKGEAS